ncbi:MAG: dehydrogenase [Epsilonproteobacteria bacterium]|nr:dehydrogenase [Campylobacterota bacterium]
MDKQTRAIIYAFLSRVFEKELGEREILDLKGNEEFLNLIGEESRKYFTFNSPSKIEEELNIDFNSLFVINSQPVETLVIDHSDEVLVGLQNPVMLFYFQNGYEIDMNKTQLLAPDHLSIEFGFMQTAIYSKEEKVAQKFLKEHLLAWVPPYLLTMKEYAQTPFYKDICDFTIDFLLQEYKP